MTPTLGSVTQVLLDLKAAFESLRVDWYVFGAQALVLRGLARATADVDVTVLPGSHQTAEVLEALEARGFIGRAKDPDFVRVTRVLPMWHELSKFPVDVVLGGPGLEELFAANASRIKVGEEAFPVASPTHIAVMKLLAGRGKDLEDVRWLLRQPDTVDKQELRELVSQLVAALADDELGERMAAVLKETETPRTLVKKPKRT